MNLETTFKRTDIIFFFFLQFMCNTVPISALITTYNWGHYCFFVFPKSALVLNSANELINEDV
jgi:hypothetical protein